MTFEEWADRTFGSNFMEEDPLTYFRMSAAWEKAQENQIEIDAGICDFHCADYTREGAEVCADAIRGQK
jgi:hypothetical protein